MMLLTITITLLGALAAGLLGWANAGVEAENS